MGERIERIPVCDGCGEDCPDGVEKVALVYDGDAWETELGGHCLATFRRLMDPLREKARQITDAAIYIPASEELLYAPPLVLGSPEAIAEAEAVWTGGGKTSDRREEVQEPGAEREEVPERKSYAELTREERAIIREWWGGSKAAKKRFGEPTNRGRLSQEVVDLYYENAARRAGRREKVPA